MLFTSVKEIERSSICRYSPSRATYNGLPF
jgi:hypothetical protein